MALAFNARVGDLIEMEHVEYGEIGTVRIDHKAGNAVRLIFDMPRTVLIRVMDHRAYGVTFGLRAEAQGPLKCAPS